jgi:uroporphyrinogen III methyltransferase/synthase
MGESLVEAFPGPDGGSGRVLLARAAVARDVVPDGLRVAGWDLDVVDVYQTVAAELDDEQLAQVAGADLVTFTSSSTVTNFCAAVGPAARPPLVVSIGPITSATARSRGLTVDAEADPHTIDGLIDAVVGALV